MFRTVLCVTVFMSCCVLLTGKVALQISNLELSSGDGGRLGLCCTWKKKTNKWLIQEMSEQRSWSQSWHYYSQKIPISVTLPDQGIQCVVCTNFLSYDDCGFIIGNAELITRSGATECRYSSETLVAPCSHGNVLGISVVDYVSDSLQSLAWRIMPQVCVPQHTEGVLAINCCKIQPSAETWQSSSVKNPTISEQITAQQADLNHHPPCLKDKEMNLSNRYGNIKSSLDGGFLLRLYAHPGIVSIADDYSDGFFKVCSSSECFVAWVTDLFAQ